MSLQVILSNRRYINEPPNTAPNVYPLYRPWGFVIYRTVYVSGEESNRSLERDWQMLLETIHTHMRVELLSRGDSDRGDDPD